MKERNPSKKKLLSWQSFDLWYRSVWFLDRQPTRWKIATTRPSIVNTFSSIWLAPYPCDRLVVENDRSYMTITVLYALGFKTIVFAAALARWKSREPMYVQCMHAAINMFKLVCFTIWVIVLAFCFLACYCALVNALFNVFTRSRHPRSYGRTNRSRDHRVSSNSWRGTTCAGCDVSLDRKLRPTWSFDLPTLCAYLDEISAANVVLRMCLTTTSANLCTPNQAVRGIRVYSKGDRREFACTDESQQHQIQLYDCYCCEVLFRSHYIWKPKILRA
jgi:hypothetical protein